MLLIDIVKFKIRVRGHILIFALVVEFSSEGKIILWDEAKNCNSKKNLNNYKINCTDYKSIKNFSRGEVKWEKNFW